MKNALPYSVHRVGYRGHSFLLPQGDATFGIGMPRFVGEVFDVLNYARKFCGMKKGTFLEVGGCFGVSCITAVTSLMVDKAIAFEPDPTNLFFLNKNIEERCLGESIRVFPNAVADFDGQSELFLTGTRNIGGHVLGRDAKRGDPEHVQVSVVQLDTLVQQKKIDPKEICFVWMDAQGCEYRICRGASTLLRLGIPWYMEVSPFLIRRQGLTPDDMYGMIQKNFKYCCDLSLSPEKMETSTLNERYKSYDYINKHGKSPHFNLLMWN